MFAGMAIFWLKKWLQPRATSPGLATVHLRLIMSDVERSLQEVHELVSCDEVRSLSVGWRGAGSPRTNRGQLSSSMQSVTSPASKSKCTADNSGSQLVGTQQPRGRSLSVNSVDGQILDLKLQSYQKKLETRRLFIARGILSFNLVRFRSEFQNLFGTNRYAVVSGEKGRSLSITRETPAQRRTSLGFGRFSLKTNLSPHLDHNTAMASTVRKWRMDRSASITSMLASRGIDAHQMACDIDAGRGTLIAELLAIMQREERADWRGRRSQGMWKVVSTAGEVLRALYRMLFTAGEELTATTQYASLSRDIAILEAPEFEVSLEQKLSTAARMRATYTCLMPHK